MRRKNFSFYKPMLRINLSLDIDKGASMQMKYEMYVREEKKKKKREVYWELREVKTLEEIFKVFFRKTNVSLIFMSCTTRIGEINHARNFVTVSLTPTSLSFMLCSDIENMSSTIYLTCAVFWKIKFVYDVYFSFSDTGWTDFTFYSCQNFHLEWK